MQKHGFWATLLVITLLGSLFQALPAQAAGTARQTILPVRISNQSGTSSGQVIQLHIQDQSGTQNDPTKFVSLNTPGVVYKGYRIYSLPSGVKLASLISLSIRVNYRGPLFASQQWSWSLFDYAAGRYVKIGDNRRVTQNAWTELAFSRFDASRYISPAGNIRLLTQSNNASGNAKIDYEAVAVTYSTNSSTPILTGCSQYPSDNIWNARVDTLAVHPNSSAWVASIGRTTGFHMDFGSGTWDGGPIGIPYNIVSGQQAKVNVDFYYPTESDPGPYPIPANPRREWGSDHHILIVDKDSCHLYEIYDASKDSSNQWSGGSGAIWDLNSHALRPAGWTSADAAGLPILPGLVRYDEVASGEIRHALRFTASSTAGYIWPARHQTSPPNPTQIPPMGARFRLKASYNISGYPPEMQVILKAMKTYGIVLADNGSDWYVSGVPDERWDNDMLHLLDDLQGSNFEAVDTSTLMVDPNSGQVTP